MIPPTAIPRVTATRYVLPLREGGSLPGLVEASDDCSMRHVALHGLLGNEATATVAAVLGVCERTVRRRARNSIRALAAAASSYTQVA